MREYLNVFRKNQALEATIFLMKKVWKHQVLLTIIIGLLSLLITFLLLGPTFLDIMKNSQEISSIFNRDPTAQQEKFEMIKSLVLGKLPELVIIGVIIIIFYGIYYVISFKINESFVKEDKFSSEIVFKNLASDFFKVIGLYFMLILIMIAAMLALGLVFALFTALNMIALFVIIVIISLFALFVFFAKFGISFSALLNGHKGIIESLQFSFKNLTIKRVVLALLFLFVVSIAASVLMMPFSFLLKDSAILGIVIYFVINIILNSISSLFVTSAQSVLYYRYSDDIIEEEDIIEHLVE